MKTRQGFVSNSSTTSFVIIGKRTKFKDINLDDGKYVAVGYSDWMEGVDVFTLTQEHLDILPFVDFEGKFYKVAAQAWDGEGKAHIPDGDYSIECGDCTYHSSDNAETLLENYAIDEYKVTMALVNGLSIPQVFINKLPAKTQRIAKMYQQGQITLEAFKELLRE